MLFARPPSLPSLAPAGFSQPVRPVWPIQPLNPEGTRLMKRATGLLLAVAVIGMSSGCSIIDRLFLLNTDGPYGHHAQGGGGGACRDGACENGQCQVGGPCESCGPGGCQPGCRDCAAGHCKKHVGRYGGLAKHTAPRSRPARRRGPSPIRTTRPGARATSSPRTRRRSARDRAAKKKKVTATIYRSPEATRPRPKDGVSR